jgi:hypothetical protein
MFRLCFYLQIFPRHKGIGSLPSATNTICSAPILGLTTGANVFGIAQYIPANANAVSTISAIVFMGEFSWAQISRPAKYMPLDASYAAATCE